jgi:glycosyltransferase involved in cell wall biosynthesis
MKILSVLLRTMSDKPLVSVIIPTKNSGKMLGACLRSIRSQSYKNIEIIIVDGASTDNTRPLSIEYQCSLLQFDPKVEVGTFDAPHRRNYGVAKSNGTYVYYVDADMELTKHVLQNAVRKCEEGCDAIIVPEESFGTGVWAQAKKLERKCYVGDDTIEAPRFFRKTVWDEVGGLDETLGGGGDDWDLHQKLKDRKKKICRIADLVLHNEGDLKIAKLIKKRFMYGRDSFKYISKRPVAGTASYFPIRKAYIKNWRLFLKQPFSTIVFIIMRGTEYSAGFAGILYSKFKRNT